MPDDITTLFNVEPSGQQRDSTCWYNEQTASHRTRAGDVINIKHTIKCHLVATCHFSRYFWTFISSFLKILVPNNFCHSQHFTSLQNIFAENVQTLIEFSYCQRCRPLLMWSNYCSPVKSSTGRLLMIEFLVIFHCFSLYSHLSYGERAISNWSDPPASSVSASFPP